MKKRVTILTFMGVIAMAASAYADHRQPPKTNPWLGSNAVAGIILNTGDTISQNVNAGLTVIYNPNRWHTQFDSTYMRATQDDKIKDQQINVIIKPSYYFQKSTSAYVSAEYRNFRNDGFNYVYRENVGFGHDLYSTPTFSWQIYAGPGLSQYKVQNDPTATRQNKLSVQYGSVLNWQISKSTGVNEKIEVNDMRDYVLSQSITRLTTQINSRLSAQLQVSLNHNSKPDTDKKKLNTTTQFNLVFNLAK